MHLTIVFGVILALHNNIFKSTHSSDEYCVIVRVKYVTTEEKPL